MTTEMTYEQAWEAWEEQAKYGWRIAEHQVEGTDGFPLYFVCSINMITGDEWIRVSPSHDSKRSFISSDGVRPKGVGVKEARGQISLLLESLKELDSRLEQMEATGEGFLGSIQFAKDNQ